MKWVIISSVFLFSFIFTFWLFRYLELRRNRIKKRVDEIESKEWQESEEIGSKLKLPNEFILTSLLWNRFGQIKLIKVLEERLHNELKKANLLMKPKEMIMLMMISAILGGLLGILLTGGSMAKGSWIGLFTWMIPLIWINSKKKKRKAKLETQLPDMISMTANSLKAGYSLLQSFELLSREMAAPLSEELQRMLQEMRLGVTTEQALSNFNLRVDSKDLDLIITAMLIQRQVGGNLAEILETNGDTIRERIKIQGEMKSLTAQGRMSMMIFMILPIGLGLMLLLSNPEYMMTLFIHPLGWIMTAIAVIGQIVGALIIKKIIRIEV